jgi:hypothetical protein
LGHIDQTIQMLEGLRALPVSAMANQTTALPSQNATATVEGPGAFLGMSIPEAAKRLLASPSSDG